MNRTKHAHCSTTVFSTWQLKRAFTHCMQNSLHVFQNRLLKLKKKKKSLYSFVFLHFINSSSEIKTSIFFVFRVSHFISASRLSKVQDVWAVANKYREIAIGPRMWRVWVIWEVGSAWNKRARWRKRYSVVPFWWKAHIRLKKTFPVPTNTHPSLVERVAAEANSSLFSVSLFVLISWDSFKLDKRMNQILGLLIFTTEIHSFKFMRSHSCGNSQANRIPLD